MIKIKDIRPVFTRIITTANRYDSDQKTGVLLDANKLEGRYKEYQTVLRVGSAVREVNVGDVVLIDPSRYMRRKFSDNSLREDFVENPIVSIDIPTVSMSDEDCFMIDQSDIAYVITDSEEVPDPIPSTIIMPKASKLSIN